MSNIKIMSLIKNPNDIVNELVKDYRDVFGDSLLSVIMYGSAVTHEYNPAKSDINIAIVLDDNSVTQISKCLKVCRKWARRRVTVPFFMTRDYIRRSLDSYPVEFLVMQHEYRVLYGDDVFASIQIDREHLRIQCERELKGAALHLRSGYIQCMGAPREVHALFVRSIRHLLPVFKALLVLGGRMIPRTKADIVAAVEDFYQLEASVLWNAYDAGVRRPQRYYGDLFEKYVRAVDMLIARVDTMIREGGGA